MGTTSRRSVLQSAALPAINLLASPAVQPKVVVVGAGAFGGWTALHLLRMGARVTLVDAWGPGNSRASSGGETRIIRATYGTDKIYYEMVKRSLEILRDSERCWNRRLYHNIGCLVFAGADESYARSSLKLFQEVGLPAEELSAMEATKRWPQISFEGIRRMVYEKDAGYLTARRNCALVLDGFLREGGVYRQLEARPGRTNGKTLAAVKLSENSELAADYFVFALGPWLGKVFPDAIGARIRPTQQQVFFFGTKPGDATFDETKIPCWINHATPPFYGIPGNEWRGFKIADDSRGPDFDPTDGERIISPERVKEARSYLAIRFPGMAISTGQRSANGRPAFC